MAQNKYRFVSKASGRGYEFTVDKGGEVYCSCPAWRFQKGRSPKDRVCKHLKALAALGVGVAFKEGMVI